MHPHHAVVVGALVLGACDVGLFEDDDGAAELRPRQLRDSLRRVVLARLYQHDQWTLTAVPDGDVAYACDVIARLRPTYVSGLLRFDAGEPLLQKHVDVYNGVRACVRERVRNHPVRFDVVLNALHYTDPAIHADRADAEAALVSRLAELDVLAPDIWFFDFFSVPFNDENTDHHRSAIREGIAWAHANQQLVGGNVWGLEPPPGADFAALDNFDRPGGVDGLEYVARQTGAMADELPLVMHIENNPQKPQSKGLLWIHGSREYRKQVLDKHASLQNATDYFYMYPVFFPLQIAGANNELRLAYDARQDGNMLDTMAEHLDRYTNR
jgi:hypothetical protein